MKNEEIEAAMHEQWVQNPVTRQMLNKITEHKNKFVELCSRDAQNPIVTDATIRAYTINIRNTDAILTLLTNKKQHEA